MKIYAPRQPLTADALAVCAAIRSEIIRVGWSETARRCGIERTALHRAFRHKPRTKSPHFSTIGAVADALGFEISIRKREEDHLAAIDRLREAGL